MEYIYAFTLFDELLLKFARYICSFERNWLASNKTLTTEDIVRCSSLDDIHQLIIDKIITELSWKGYSDKLLFFNNHGINTDSLDSELFSDTIEFISEKRNVIVHSGGTWNASVYNKLKKINM